MRILDKIRTGGILGLRNIKTKELIAEYSDWGIGLEIQDWVILGFGIILEILELGNIEKSGRSRC